MHKTEKSASQEPDERKATIPPKHIYRQTRLSTPKASHRQQVLRIYVNRCIQELQEHIIKKPRVTE
jgi:hypothetical protein